MALEIIGSGFGRTGTTTLKGALERLGFATCHHMVEVFANPGSAAQFSAAARREKIDWDALFAGYRSQLDWPACHFWRELAAHFPKAKVLHTVRETPEAWYKSFAGTILNVLKSPPPPDPNLRAQWQMAQDIITDQTFQGALDDPKVAMDVYRRREAEVRAAIPPDRLLVYNVSEGWEPLCKFLGVPVPGEPMPKTNTTDDFMAMFRARRG